MKTPKFLDPVMTRLRGEHHSIRARFGTAPKEAVLYAWHRLRGGTWLEFYRRRVNDSSQENLDAPLPEAYLAEAGEHAAFLRRNGLAPSHRLLDYGCGSLRLGYHVIPYLSSGRYVGAEIAETRVERGRRMLERAGIARDRYEIVVVSDCTLKELAPRQFDVAWAKSVFTHMPDDDIRTALVAMRARLAPGGRFYFTFTPAERPRRFRLRDFYHPPEYMRGLVESCGYDLAVMPDWPLEKFGDLMGCARPKDRP